MKEKLKNLFFKIKRHLSKLAGKKYIRKGSCKGCGACCRNIHVRNGSIIIKDEEEFLKLQKIHFFYEYLEIADKNEMGLIFRCKKLGEDGRCKAYKQRALICRQYPMEEIFTMGGTITEDCGFWFEPIDSFESVLNKVKEKL